MTLVRGDFEAAFDRLYPRAEALARRIVGEWADAEDVAAEALARTYARWSKVRELPHLDAWVLRVTGNLAIDVMRRRTRRHPAPADTAAAPDTTLLRLALAVALQSLPRRQREVIVLRYLTDLSEDDVALALGISPATVRTHVHRAFVQLRGRMGPDFEEADLALA